MAEIHAILKRFEHESDSGFHDRCSDFLATFNFPGAVSYGAIAVGRMTLIDGRHLNPDVRWGQANTSPLPADSCVIASYTLTEARSSMYKVDVAQLRRAPVNPQTFPRLAHQMSLDEFSASIDFKKTSSVSEEKDRIEGEVWRVLLDGVDLGEYKHSQLDASRLAHKEQVRLALECCKNPGVETVSILPSKHALVWHPEFSKDYEREFSLIKPGILWTQAMSDSSCSEGWNILPLSDTTYESYRGIRVALDQSKKINLKDIESALLVISQGNEDHHLIARTILATSSPMEYQLMMDSVQDWSSEFCKKRSHISQS